MTALGPAPRLSLPRASEPPAPFRFPVIASTAPVIVALALWLITSSPYVLLFAALGPVMAVAAFADARLGARRLARRERARLSLEFEELRRAIAAAHDGERAMLIELAPGAGAIAQRSGPDADRWRHDAGAIPVVLGLGPVASRVELDGPTADPEAIAATTLAATLLDAPVVVDAALGIGVCGTGAVARSHARALALQLAWSLSPARYRCRTTEAWNLPHPRDTVDGDEPFAEFSRIDGEPVAMVALAEREDRLPRHCRIVVTVDADGARVTKHPDPARRVALAPDLVSSELAQAWATRCASDAEAEGIVTAESGVPGAVRLADVPQGRSTADSLSCSFAVGARGPVAVDLVRDGPHAVIGGTTGSGKSELLTSWVLAMARSAPPEQVTFLLIDFKGGATFSPLAPLPHTVGIVSDLDEAEAARALESLRAELRHRERAIAAAGARSIEQVTGVPRLVIVVDEFAAMLVEHPELHALFADLAARGRSLGMHLVLCTQRPAGAVRDAVLANADLRVSLRVNNAADSTAVVGTDAAARLPPPTRGAAILVRGGGAPERVQIALADVVEVAEVAALWPDSPPPRRPWCEPLPRVVRSGELEPATSGTAFGITDLPREQRRGTAVWSGEHGHALVLGSAGSGKSRALAALAPTAIVVPSGVAAAWDVIESLSEAHDAVVAIDDLDSLCARIPADFRDALLDALARLLRDGPARGVRVAASAQRVTAELHTIAALMPSRLLLAHAHRQEWLLAGGESADFVADQPPGRGVWRGDRVQVALVAGEPLASAPVVGVIGPGQLAVVSSRPVDTTRRLIDSGRTVVALADIDPEQLAASGTGVAVVGDVEDWQSRWGALAALRPVAEVLFDGCSVADLRALTRSRRLPPPLDGVPGALWRLEPDGAITRAVLARPETA